MSLFLPALISLSLPLSQTPLNRAWWWLTPVTCWQPPWSKWMASSQVLAVQCLIVSPFPQLLRWAQHCMVSRHIWMSLTCSLGEIASSGRQQVMPQFSHSYLTFNVILQNIHKKVWNKAESVLLGLTLSQPSLDYASVQKEKFALSPQWLKLMIIQALWVWKTNSCLVAFGLILYIHAAADVQSALHIQSPYFSADVCNYSTDLSNESKTADHMTPPPSLQFPPLFPQKPHSSLISSAAVSSLLCTATSVRIFFFCFCFAQFSKTGHLHYGWHLLEMTDED